jgi:hypothetical protein
MGLHNIAAVSLGLPSSGAWVQGQLVSGILAFFTFSCGLSRCMYFVPSTDPYRLIENPRTHARVPTQKNM